MYDLFGVCITFNCYCNQIRVSTNSTHALSNYLPVVRELIKIYRERNRPRIPSNPCWIIWCVATAWISLSFTECLTLIKLNSIYISRARANKTQRERENFEVGIRVQRQIGLILICLCETVEFRHGKIPSI